MFECFWISVHFVSAKSSTARGESLILKVFELLFRYERLYFLIFSKLWNRRARNLNIEVWIMVYNCKISIILSLNFATLEINEKLLIIWNKESYVRYNTSYLLLHPIFIFIFIQPAVVWKPSSIDFEKSKFLLMYTILICFPILCTSLFLFQNLSY